MSSAPFYILFAGVNGAGKSTLFRTGMWQGNLAAPLDDVLPRINNDEIIVENCWNWRDQSAQMQAGRIAIRRIREYFARRVSFNQETTLTGRSIMRNIQDAHDMGYRIIMFYIGLDSPELASERVAKRDSVGGHFIPPGTVFRRYEASLSNLEKAIPLCDEAFLYDNSEWLELEACFRKDELLYFNSFGLRHAWVKNACAPWTTGAHGMAGPHGMHARHGRPARTGWRDPSVGALS